MQKSASDNQQQPTAKHKRVNTVLTARHWIQYHWRRKFTQNGARIL